MENQENELRLEGRHSVMEAFRAGKLIERLFVLKGCQDGPVLSILREAKKPELWWILYQKNAWII